MNDLNLLRLEGPELDYKLTLPETEQLARLFVAMANTKGGTIIVGIKDTSHEVVGVTPNQRIEEHLANVAAEVCAPAVEYQVSYETVAAKTVMIIKISAGHAKPYYLRKLGLDRGAFVRIGSTCRLADREMLKRLTREGENRSFDAERSTLTKKDLDLKLLETYLTRRHSRLGTAKKPVSDDLLKDLNLIDGDKLTITGALLFAVSPQKDLQLSGALIRAARFKGKERGIFIDQQDISGDLPQQIEHAVKFIIRNIPLKSIHQGLSRLDQYDYSIEVLRELVTNAIVHRDYSVTNESIQLAVFDDRVEVTSPGGLPGDLTVENFMHRQHSRNPIIAKRMFEMGHLEAWGLGIDTIISWSKKAGRSPPLFTDADNQFTCTIYATPERVPAKNELSDTEQAILMHFREQESLSNKQLRALCRLSKTQVHTAVSKLLKRKLIRRQGNGPAVLYSLVARG